MYRKHVLFVADSLENAHKFQQVLSKMDVDVSAASGAQFKRTLLSSSIDLVIYEMHPASMNELAAVERTILEQGQTPVLAIVRPEAISALQLPPQLRCDFVSSTATPEECAFRVRTLLGEEMDTTSADLVSVDSMTINLATYQVQIAGNPVDLTYLEYALLAFLVTHPGRTYSRDALLRRVWGFDYYGGSRTVDVHVRRVRAKIGPDLSQHLETVRGVGYLWD